MPELQEYIPQKERDSYDADDFAGPDRSFPVTTQAQLDAAAHLIGHAADPDAVKRKAIAIAKRKGFTLPASWKDDGKKEESAATVASSVVKPKKKIATLKVCFLEYNARSLNGRIYPKATCDKIYESMQRKLADPNALPMTCFVSHEAANGNANTELVGRVVGGSQEGGKFYANIDFADTRVAGDQLALVEGGYMRSESMRVSGVELVHDRNHDLPLVVAQEGIEPELMGIDLTTRPGLMDTARIQQVLYESQGAAVSIETSEDFTLTDVQLETQKGTPAMGTPLYLRAALGPIEEAMTADRAAHQKIHDTLAGVLDATVAAKHGSESARLMALVEAELSEEGRAIAKVHATKIAAAHDTAAHQLGMDCEGAYNEALGVPAKEDPDRDGIPDDEDPIDLQSKKGEETLTEQEMLEALKAKGFNIVPPKSREQELQEAFDAKLAEQERKFNEKLAALQESTPQRQTQVTSSFQEQTPSALQPEEMYETGDYLAGTLNPKNWKQLSNRRVPWPKDMDPQYALFELAPFIEFQLLSAQETARGRNFAEMVRTGEYDQMLSRGMIA